MKKLNYLLIALFSFLVISCNRSDEMPPQPQDKLIGSWGLTKTRLKGNMIILGINTPIDMDAPITPCEKKQKLLFCQVVQELQRYGRIYQGAVKRKEMAISPTLLTRIPKNWLYI